MDARRAIPAIDRLLSDAALAALGREAPRERIVSALQTVQARLRASLAAGEPPPPVIADPDWYAAQVRQELARWRHGSLLPVINATGVVLHTNLGRAPLAGAAVAALIEAAAGYTNLEYDLEQGARGSRYDHCVGQLRRLTGAEDALVVNNAAAAVLLALNTLALGGEAIISRGELIEIGGAFRVPEIMARSGARMVEVGTTNRTYLSDYAAALRGETRALIKVHRSNFRQSGFVSEAGLEELVALARERAVPLLYDLGSGLLLPAAELGLPDEQDVASAVAAGPDLVAISGDKLLGGPQAGILLGRAAAVAACRANPLCRALRPDKLTLAALGATLALYTDPELARREVPALRMLAQSPEEMAERAARIRELLTEAGVPCELLPGESRVGGGALPEVALPTTLLRVRPRSGAVALERALREQRPPIVARIQDEHLLLDPRTVQPAEEPALVSGVATAWRA